jgi:hypothetical protein
MMKRIFGFDSESLSAVLFWQDTESITKTRNINTL